MKLTRINKISPIYEKEGTFISVIHTPEPYFSLTGLTTSYKEEMLKIPFMITSELNEVMQRSEPTVILHPYICNIVYTVLQTIGFKVINKKINIEGFKWKIRIIILTIT